MSSRGSSFLSQYSRGVVHLLRIGYDLNRARGYTCLPTSFMFAARSASRIERGFAAVFLGGCATGSNYLDDGLYNLISYRGARWLSCVCHSMGRVCVHRGSVRWVGGVGTFSLSAMYSLMIGDSLPIIVAIALPESTGCSCFLLAFLAPAFLVTPSERPLCSIF